MENTCEACGLKFESVKPARTCSPKCRVTLSRSRVTHGGNVTLAEPDVTHDVTFEFTVAYNKKPGDKGYDADVDKKRKTVRTALYWYDVPIAAIPRVKKSWPKIPHNLNGRQYFLWWKNEFKVTDEGTPIIHNPFPRKKGDVNYVKAGEGSRHWGTV